MEHIMKGILLAGGNGTRLSPSTNAISKHLLPIYDKPMIYYSLSILMLAKIKDILLISKPDDTGLFYQTLGDGSNFGISINYAVQNDPTGIPEAFKIGKHFIGNDDVCLVLGDNIIFGTGLPQILQDSKSNNVGTTIFTYGVSDPTRYGVLELDNNYQPAAIIEKPKKTSSKLATVGLYMFDNTVVTRSSELKKSDRGETEIADLLNIYLKEKKFSHRNFGRGFTWFDTGTHSSLLAASQFVETVEIRQGYKIACLEEIAFHNGWISEFEIIKRSQKFPDNCYGKYLKSVARYTRQQSNFLKVSSAI